MNKYSNSDAVENYANPSMQMGDSKPLSEVPTVLGEFSKRMEKGIAELHSLADRIDVRLNKIQNTNFPTPNKTGEYEENVREVRGNDDLEYDLFKGLESLSRVSEKLQDSLSKLERII